MPLSCFRVDPRSGFPVPNLFRYFYHETPSKNLRGGSGVAGTSTQAEPAENASLPVDVIFVDHDEGNWGPVLWSAAFNRAARGKMLPFQSAAAGFRVSPAPECDQPHRVAILSAKVHLNLDVRDERVTPFTLEWAQHARTRCVIAMDDSARFKVIRLGIPEKKVIHLLEILKNENVDLSNGFYELHAPHVGLTILRVVNWIAQKSA